jgi:hypothetical protein
MKKYYVLLTAALGALLSIGGCGNSDDSGAVSTVAQRVETDPLHGTLSIKDDWGSGYRAEVKLCNQGSVPTTSWRAVVSLNQSTFTGAYNANAVVSGNTATFTPNAEWIAVLQPGQCQSFGFMANASGANYHPTLLGVCSKNAWTDYCAAGGSGGAGGTGGVPTGGAGTGGCTGGTGATGGATGGTGGSTGGSSGSGGAPHTDYQISIELPYGLAWTDVALYSSRELKVDDYSKTLKADLTHAPVVSMGDAVSNMGVDSQVGDLWSVPHVFLRSSAEVYGTLRTGDSWIEKQAQIDPVVIPTELTSYDFRPISTVRWQLEVPLGTVPGPVLSPGQYRFTPLLPGAYSGTNLAPNSTLRLSAGTFYFRNGLTVEPGATLQLLNSTGLVVLVVVDSCVIHGQITRQANTPNVLLVYLGTSDLNIETGLNATVLAPYAKVLTGSYKSYKGAIFGRDVEMQPNSQLTLQPFSRPDCVTAGGGCGSLVGCLPVDSDHDSAFLTRRTSAGQKAVARRPTRRRSAAVPTRPAASATAAPIARPNTAATIRPTVAAASARLCAPQASLAARAMATRSIARRGRSARSAWVRASDTRTGRTSAGTSPASCRTRANPIVASIPPSAARVPPA